MTTNANISIDLAIYESQLRGEIAADLATLQLVLKAVSQPDYISQKYILHQKMTISEIAVPPADFLKRREINKCFKSIIGSVQDYLDKLIAILRLKSEQISVSRPLTNDEINDLLKQKFEKHLLDVSTDRSLNIPKKLNLILDRQEDQIYKDSMQSYFDVRNGLEHHKGIAKDDRVVKYKRIGLASTAGYEVEKPGPLGPNEGLVLKTFDEEIVYEKGGELLITKDHLDSILLSLLIFAIPAVQQSVGAKFNATTA